MNNNFYTPFIKLSLSMAVSLTLYGCGGGSDESEETSPLIEAPANSNFGTLYYAQDIIRQSTPSDTFYVDLSNGMESSDGSSVKLTSVIPLSDDNSCEVISQDGDGFTIRAQSVKTCDYRYRIGPTISSRSQSGTGTIEASAHSTTGISGDGFAEATVRAAVGESTELLVPISQVTSSFTSVTIDIPIELGNNGYSLDTGTYSLSTTITLPNGSTTNSTAIANPSLNTIEYTPGSGIPSGVERILYTYSDGSNVLSGSIDIAVSTNTNGAPIAESRRKTSYIHPDSGKEVSKIPYGKTMRFDVAELISDPDGDTLHLVDIFSYGATISIPFDANSDGNAFNDTEFDFTSLQPGETAITYVVSDGKGGYASGVIQGYIGNPYEPIYVSSNAKVYLPPLLYNDAVDAGIAAKPQTGNGTTALLDIKNAVHDWDTADAVCRARKARLATTTELTQLYNYGNTNGALFTNHNWPVDINYWASTLGTSGSSYHRTTNLANGTINSNELNAQDRYVSCIAETPPGYPVKFLGDDVGNDYLFDIRINSQVRFGCGYIVDYMEQVGGAHVGGNGGAIRTVDLSNVGRVVAKWGVTEFGTGNDLSRLQMYNRSGAMILNCGSKNYSGHTTDSYLLSDDEILTGFRATGDSYANGIELWVDLK